jgi:hypothetical protein
MQIRNNKKFYSLAFTVLVIFRILFHTVGGESQHAPLNYLYYFLFSSLIGIDNYGFRLASLLLMTFTSFVIFKMLTNMGTKVIQAFLSSLLVFSIPLIKEMGIMIEVSLWTLVINALALIALQKRRFIIPDSMLVLIAISCYLRMNLLILYFASLLLYTSQNRNIFRSSVALRASFLTIIPCVVQTITSRMLGGQNFNLNLETIKRNMGNSAGAIVDSGSLLFVIVSYVIAIYIVLVQRKAFLFFASHFLFSFIIFVCFNSSDFSTNSKYIVEWGLAPVFLLASSQFTRSFILFRYGALILALIMNIFGINEQNKVTEKFNVAIQNEKVDYLDAFSILPRIPLNFNDTVRYLRANNLESRCLVVGPVYSVFHQILGDVGVSEVWSLHKKRNNFLAAQRYLGESWLTVSNDSLEKADVGCIVVGVIKNRAQIISSLNEQGWFTLHVSWDKKYGTAVHVLRKYPEKFVHQKNRKMLRDIRVIR